MMEELGIKDFTTIVVTKLEELQSSGLPDIVLENPKATSKFPCIVVQSPLVFIERTGVLQRFSVIVENWAKKKYDVYNQADLVDTKLRELNFIKTSTPIDFYDEITGCYRYGGSYEVLYNVLTNTFEKVKN